MTDQPLSKHGLLSVTTFIIARPVIEETIAFLRHVGEMAAEGFVLWGGTVEDEGVMRFSRAVIPEQQALRTPDGLLVLVEGDALFRANKLLHEGGMILGGQVHTHPTSAYHSDTDDHYPLVTLLGALSLVIPNFARNAPDDVSEWAWYRLRGYGRWCRLGEETKVRFE